MRFGLSLTKFISLPDVKARFEQEFPLPVTTLKGQILAPPVTKNYSLVGIAFDYLMRFYLERLNPGCVTHGWVAETSVEFTKLSGDPGLFDKASKLLKLAKKNHQRYIKTGKLGDYIFTSAIHLAQLDIIYRAGKVDPNMGRVDPGDLDDLSNLIALVKPELFRSRVICMLNPTFGEASILVGGADADIVIDDTLIEIKTSKYLKFNKEHYHQLVGYYLLSKIGGCVGDVKGLSLNKLGIYYSRYGILHTVTVETIENKPNLKQFIKWFVKRAKEEDLSSTLYLHSFLCFLERYRDS